MDFILDLAVLTRATRLLLMGVGVFDRFCDRFPVGDLRLTHFNVNVVRASQYVDLNVEMQLAHALDQRFA